MAGHATLSLRRADIRKRLDARARVSRRFSNLAECLTRSGKPCQISCSRAVLQVYLSCSNCVDFLIVDEDVTRVRSLQAQLKTAGHRHSLVADRKEAARFLKKEQTVDAMFIRVEPDEPEVLGELRDLAADHPEIPVMAFGDYAVIETAVSAIREGAMDYFALPLQKGELEARLEKVREELALRRQRAQLKETVAAANPTPLLDSRDEKMRANFDLLFRAAASEANILLLGPSGTGKSVLAREVHSRSQRASGPFVTVNCPSLSRELLESDLFGHVKGSFTSAVADKWGKVAAADGGTLFMDEIGELPLEIQPKLLRLLQERAYERIGETRTREADVRVIAATNRNLEAEVEAGNFREDLFYRLNVISVKIPPLKDRPDDIILFAENYLAFFGARHGRAMTLSDELREQLKTYAWPGNLRELRNVIERAVILSSGQALTMRDLPPELQMGSGPVLEPGDRVTLEELEEVHLRSVLARTESLQQAAHILGIDNATLYRKRRKLGL